MIEISGLTKSYNDHIVLRDINLFIQEGEIFGIIGSSGAGKIYFASLYEFIGTARLWRSLGG